MRKVYLFIATIGFLLSSSLSFAQAPPAQAAPDPCASGHEFATTDCTLTWHGITLYGAYDVGAGWVSHGLPENGYNYEGESLVNRNGDQHRFVVAPNNLQQTGFGIRGKEEFLPGWSVVFNGSTGINPQSGLLANASKTDIINNGLPRASYSIAIDGARAGQPFNDEYYGGISSKRFGTLTFGRQRSLGTDAMLLTIQPEAPMPFPISGITARWPAVATPKTAVGMTPSSIASRLARFISARCMNSPTVLPAATRPPRAGLAPRVRRNRRITTPMDSISAENPASSLPTSSSSITTRRSAY
jgi:hypothetical protein